MNCGKWPVVFCCKKRVRNPHTNMSTIGQNTISTMRTGLRV